MANPVRWLGIHTQPVHKTDAALSALGGFLGILIVLLVTRMVLGETAAVIIIPSMGASAVLLFAAPHAPFSQPWNLMGGHALSALVGVACWQWIPQPDLAAAASVGLATGLMYLARCIHPPGGATALAAVIGSENVHALGYGYEFQPVLINTITILLAAILFNALWRWRRYPAAWSASPGSPPTADAEQKRGYPDIRHEDFVYALSELSTLADVSEEDLVRIYRLATQYRQTKRACR